MEEIMRQMMAFTMFMFVIGVIVYIFFAIFLNKFNELVEGDRTVLAWIPFANIYLLGKLAVSKPVGIALLVGNFLIGNITTTDKYGFETSTPILGDFSGFANVLYKVIFVIILIYAITKYDQLKKNPTNRYDNDNNI